MLPSSNFCYSESISGYFLTKKVILTTNLKQYVIIKTSNSGNTPTISPSREGRLEVFPGGYSAVNKWIFKGTLQTFGNI